MKIAAVIPSRYNSSRFTGKPLVRILGKTMIERVYQQVEKCTLLSEIIVATDDERIATEVESFGGQFAYTHSGHRSGTERLWEVFEPRDFDAVINVQGDEPIISEKLITDIYHRLQMGNCQVVTAAYKKRRRAYG